MEPGDIDNLNLVPAWQLTATTMHCQLVCSEVTILVYKDWSTACVYHKRWGPVRKEKVGGVSRIFAWLGILAKKKHIPVSCPGPNGCDIVSEYREKIRQEEAASRY